MPIMHAGNDYLVNTQNLSSRIFTVVFQSKQASSSEHVIEIANDQIFEGREDFRLRIVAVRFNGQAAALFRAQNGMTSTFVDVNIQDDDSKFKKTTCIYHLFTNYYEEDMCRGHLMYCSLQLYMSIGQYHGPFK